MKQAGVTLALLCSLGSAALAQSLAQTADEIATRFGTLTVDVDKVLRFNGRALEPAIKGNNSLSLGTLLRVGATDIVLIQDNGGTACPFLYYFVSVTKSDARATPSFGTCGEISTVKRTGNSILVTMTGYRGPFEPMTERRAAQRERHVFVFRNGTVKERSKSD